MGDTADWRQIEEADFIEVSRLGEVRRKSRDLVVASRDAKGYSTGNFRPHIPGGEIKPWLANTGYLIAFWMDAGKRKKVPVHRLVARAFVPGHFEGATVDHVDGNKLNNRADNLEWVSLAENSRRQNAAGRGVPKGEKHPLAKLRDADVMTIAALRNDGMSVADIARKFSVSTALIYKILSGKKRKSVFGSG